MENTNSPTYTDFERKKWFISRIDLYHKINIESIETAKRIFDSAGEKSLSIIKSWRSGIFSVLGIVLTAILGINTIYPIIEWVFYLSLAILSGAGLINFIICNWIIGFVENAFNFISNLSANERIIISESQSFVAVNFADLEKIEFSVGDLHRPNQCRIGRRQYGDRETGGADRAGGGAHGAVVTRGRYSRPSATIFAR